MIEKVLIVVNGMTGQETPIKVASGATPAAVLGKLGFGGYQLARVKDRQILQDAANLDAVVAEGERLFAFAPMIVGGWAWVA
jgi:sulfur carrier protein ThiS